MKIVPRPKRQRRVFCEPDYDYFMPNGISPPDDVVLNVDEYEVIRLVDYQKLTHEQAALQMDISRTTVTEIYESARHKIADSIVNGRRLKIMGGHYRVCGGPQEQHDCGCHANGPHRQNSAKNSNPPKKGNVNIMRIAVAYENGNVFQHFGHTETFKFYDIENDKIISEKTAPVTGGGHGAIAGFLAANQTDAVICGGIGGGAQNALAQAGIKLYGGVTGSADEAVKALILGQLNYNPDVKCSHHDSQHGQHEHNCGEHHCGDHHCGGHGHHH